MLEGTIADKNEQWQVYIVRCADGSLYTGIAKDVESRLSQHNAGRGARYTRGRRPVMLVYREPAPDRGAALRREHEIKSMSRVDKRRMIDGSTSPISRRRNARNAEARDRWDRESD